MKIKRRHIKMARAAHRLFWNGQVAEPTVRNAVENTRRWHRAAKGKHQ